MIALNAMMIGRKPAVIGILALALALGAPGAALADLVVNGGFDGTPGLLSNPATDVLYGNTVTITGWTATGYTGIFAPGTADTTGLQGQGISNRLWGPNDSNPGDPQYPGGGGPYLPATSPVGGNFAVTDGGYLSGQLYQNISGLTPGAQYVLGFWWAGAQLWQANGATTQFWQVSLGSETHSTSTVNVASHGFSPWTYQTLNFTATSITENLLFQAVGSPAVPPMLLLDGVSLVPAPEPSSLSIVVIALMCGCAVALRRRARNKAAAN